MERVPFTSLTFCPETGRALRDGAVFSGLTVHEDGGPFRAESEYLNGLEHGVARVWWLPTGTLNSERHCAEGLPHGLTRNWYPDGKLRDERYYENGTCIRGRDWNQDGELIKEFEGLPPNDHDWFDDDDQESDPEADL